MTQAYPGVDRGNMTSEVMAKPPTQAQALPMRLTILIAAFVLFTAYTAMVAATHGVLGFLTLAWREPWAMQMLLDLCMALTVACTWLAGDARRRGLHPWPFVVSVVLAGSVGVLAYLVRRELAAPRPAPLPEGI